MSKYQKNHLKKSFLDQFPRTSLASSDIREKCKFNLSYFENTQADGSSFEILDAPTLADILSKTQAFSCNHLGYWRNKRCGGGGLKIYADYDAFPLNSTFKFPKGVPHDVKWGRFRLDNLTRLVGFTIPNNIKPPKESEHIPFDHNAFYLVFIDLEHKFYITEDR